MKEKTKVVCHHCECVVSASLVVRDVPCSSGEFVYKDIPCYTCDVCGDVVATPPEAAKLIKEQRRVALAECSKDG